MAVLRAGWPWMRRLVAAGAVVAALVGCGQKAEMAGSVTYTVQPASPAPAPTPVAAGRAAAAAPDSEWRYYGGNYSAWRYSPLTQINRTNVGRLKVAWTYDTGMHDAFECTPIVTGGVMYVTTPWNHAMALDPRTGRVLWRYAKALPDSLPLCCGAVNRGAAVGGGKVIFATLDAHLVALDAKTGKQAWDVQMGSIKDSYSATAAPQIIGNKVIQGISGGDFGCRGFIDAYDVGSGKRLWRFYTIPGPGEPGHDTWGGDSWKTGGGPCWMTPTYDPATNTLYAGIGNPCPDLDAAKRPGDNLYTECTVALDADSGRLKWHYQTIPNDPWDLDNVIEPVLDQVTVDGRVVKAAFWAGKNGYFYMLDRTNGKFIYALPYVHQLNWGYVDETGKPHPDPRLYPVRGKWTVVYPGASGGKEWVPVAYDPARKRMFIPVIELGHMHKVMPQEYHGGYNYWGGASVTVPGSGYGHIVAIDVEKREIAWDTITEFPVVCGVLCTAGGLVITGTPDQKMLILDADTGKILRVFRGISGWHSGPISYALGGKQYIAFANGWGGWVAGFNGVGTPELAQVPPTNRLYVFCLP